MPKLTVPVTQFQENFILPQVKKLYNKIYKQVEQLGKFLHIDANGIDANIKSIATDFFNKCTKSFAEGLAKTPKEELSQFVKTFKAEIKAEVKAFDLTSLVVDKLRNDLYNHVMR